MSDLAAAITVPAAPRYIVDQHPTIRVLDTDHCHRIIREWDRGTRRIQLRDAQTLAAELNEREGAEAGTTDEPDTLHDGRRASSGRLVAARRKPRRPTPSAAPVTLDVGYQPTTKERT